MKQKLLLTAASEGNVHAVINEGAIHYKMLMVKIIAKPYHYK
jgi:hypothetical protein